jgi:hypothetical protein
MNTAIQELIQVVEMDYNNGVEISMKVFFKMLKDAQTKEQEQIYAAFVAGSERGTKHIPFNCEQYYTQTFGQVVSSNEIKEVPVVNDAISASVKLLIEATEKAGYNNVDIDCNVSADNGKVFKLKFERVDVV